MKNLEQIRAAQALADERSTTKRDVTKLPAMIVNNGLLAAVAFANETNDKGKPKRPGMKAAMDSVARHLGHAEIGITLLSGAQSAGDITRKLTTQPATAVDLQRATGETLAYVGYLKRFASESGDEITEED